MRFTALQPPPPTPTTLIGGSPSEYVLTMYASLCLCSRSNSLRSSSNITVCSYLGTGATGDLFAGFGGGAFVSLLADAT